MSHSQDQLAFWNLFRADRKERGQDPGEEFEAWYFCDSEECANELAELVLAGIKTATASLFRVYEAEDEKVPEPGEYSVVTDWDGNPLCVIETTEIRILPFNQVDAGFAYDEGEGDRSLDYWREVHWRFFSRECGAIGLEPDEDMLVVCERFHVVFLPDQSEE